MEMQEIDVFIDKSGEVRLEVRGVKGSKCLDITKQLEAALGGQIASREMTPEAKDGCGVHIASTSGKCWDWGE